MICELRRTSELVGTLYPVLTDKNGNIVDGHHRLKADPNWPRVELQGAYSKERKLIARLLSNLCRRSMSANEKRKIITDLGYIYLQQGVPTNALVKKISNSTGMSYRWVMMYAPDSLKVRPGLGGPKPIDFYETEKNLYKSKVASLSTADSLLFGCPKQKVASITSYSNTTFVNFAIEKEFYLKFCVRAKQLGADINIIINNALLIAFEKIEKIAKMRGSLIELEGLHNS